MGVWPDDSAASAYLIEKITTLIKEKLLSGGQVQTSICPKASAASL